jgi:thiamine pyrophosphokinase
VVGSTRYNHTDSIQYDEIKKHSLIPFGDVSGVTLVGCKYSLENDQLSSGTRGIHNEALGEQITVSCQQGDLLLLIRV